MNLERDFIYRQTLVWLEVEGILRCTTGAVAPICQNCRDRQDRLAESLTNHLWNNWEMVERAKITKGRQNEAEDAAAMFDGFTKDTPGSMRPAMDYLEKED